MLCLCGFELYSPTRWVPLLNASLLLKNINFNTLAKLAKSTVNFNFAKRYFENLADIQKT